MKIPAQAQVTCTDGVGGRSVYVLMNPILDQVTHLVVEEDSSPHTEYIVPFDMVSATTADSIDLRCSTADLRKMDPFVQLNFIKQMVPDYESTSGGFGMGTYYWPYVSSGKTVEVPVEERQIPLGEVAVERGTMVTATDGFVGKVDEFLVNPADGQITHLVMREGHLWGKKEVTIPLSAIEKAGEESILLKLSKHEIEALPTIPVHRLWA